MARAPEIVPCRVGVAYVSLRVTPQSTARTVVLEVLPLLGRQVCTWACRGPGQPSGPGCHPGPGMDAPRGRWGLVPAS